MAKPVPNQNMDNNATSGIADVRSTEDNHGKLSGSFFIPISGTIGPNQAWFQSGLANVPLPESTAFFSGHNSLYVLPANASVAPIQTSGTPNVPKSESSWNH